jgi:hypothetical protein
MGEQFLILLYAIGYIFAIISTPYIQFPIILWGGGAFYVLLRILYGNFHKEEEPTFKNTFLLGLTSIIILSGIIFGLLATRELSENLDQTMNSFYGLFYSLRP